jgi:sensor domain CHASE-containing protein
MKTEQNNQRNNEKYSSLNHIKALVVFIISILCTFIFANFENNEVEKELNQDMALVCKEIQSKIEIRLHSHAQLLRDGASFFKF